MAALGALYKAASQQTVTLADKGYVGAGIGVLTPIKGTRPCPYDATYNLKQAALRAPAERANAMLKHFKALRRVSLDPSTITRIATTVLVITTSTEDSGEKGSKFMAKLAPVLLRASLWRASRALLRKLLAAVGQVDVGCDLRTACVGDCRRNFSEVNERRGAWQPSTCRTCPR